MSVLLKQLGSRCWYCGVELVPNGKWIKDEKGYGIAVAHIDTRREITRDRHDGFLVLSCRACRSQRKGKPLEEYRRWLALRTPEGIRWQALDAALKVPNLPADERAAIEKRMAELEKALVGYKFFAEKLYEGPNR